MVSSSPQAAYRHFLDPLCLTLNRCWFPVLSMRRPRKKLLRASIWAGVRSQKLLIWDLLPDLMVGAFFSDNVLMNILCLDQALTLYAMKFSVT